MSGSRIGAWAACALAGLALAGCRHDVGVADRCVDVVDAAYPDTGIDITTRSAEVKDDVAIAEIAGVKDGEPVAAECRFDRNVLTAFRWRQQPFAGVGSGSSQPPP